MSGLAGESARQSGVDIGGGDGEREDNLSALVFAGEWILPERHEGRMHPAEKSGCHERGQESQFRDGGQARSRGRLQYQVRGHDLPSHPHQVHD